jgi:hypothetical protein
MSHSSGRRPVAQAVVRRPAFVFRPVVVREELYVFID